MTNPIISIDRAARKWAIFDNHFDLVHPFTPYTEEVAALKAAHEWVAARTPEESKVVYPLITKMRMS